MKTNDLPQFARLLKLLDDVYRYTITEELGDACWQILRKYELKQIEQAIYDDMSTPTVITELWYAPSRKRAHL